MAVLLKKMQKKKIFKNGIHSKLDLLHFGNCGLFAAETGNLKKNEINAIQIFLRRKIKKVGRLWIFLNFNKHVTVKSSGIRMGKGKGEISYSICTVLKDQLIIEIDVGKFKNFALDLLKIASKKLSIRTYIRFKQPLIE